jgi:hypothetical protein
MTDFSFRHPGLNTVVHSEAMILLHEAALKIPTASPVDALGFVDCDRKAILGLVSGARIGLEHFSQAHDTFRQGQRHAKQNWTGMAAAHFDQDASVVHTYYVQSMDATDATCTVGERVADQLDQIAGSTGGQAEQIAMAVQPSSEAVVSGASTVEDVENVNNACNDVLSLVSAALGQIGELGGEFGNLTSARPTPANYPS